MFEAEDDAEKPTLDNPEIPAGYTVFGQFVSHDITFDATSSLQRQSDPDRLHNFRTPRFDIDSLYGGGPQVHPQLYDRPDIERLLIGRTLQGVPVIPDARLFLYGLEAGDEEDLPRNHRGVALLSDSRNDENVLISQLHLAFLRLHNAALKWTRQHEGRQGAFQRAQQLVRWHYQWVVLHDFLPRLVGKERAAELLPPGEPPRLRWYRPRNNPFIPVEFSAAAFRIGHSMVRASYMLNASTGKIPIFTEDPLLETDLRGSRPLRKNWTVDWSRFFEIDGAPPQPSRQIDSRLNYRLREIPLPDGTVRSLALRNLLRGLRLGLPSGQAVGRKMGERVYDNAELDLDPTIGREAPLWLYILKEAENTQEGRCLGAVGGRIVAEVLVGLAAGDANCFLNVEPQWRPFFGHQGGDYELRDLLRFAGVTTFPRDLP